MDSRKIFDGREGEASFIKTVQKPGIDGGQKAALNRKGNVLLSEGDVEAARRIFLTTGYSDGLARVGDHYKSQGRVLDALRMYWVAPDKTKAEGIIKDLSGIIKNLIQENRVEEK
ncbi:MAG: hypothetical protein LBC88_02685 [Spirochaetaceae bacterium]|jgi:hypothetical protein|nr:hypothetical protein [Spirochaetaceae bacterium]